MTKVLAVISFIDSQGNPVDPGFGGGISGIHPSHDLPNAPVRPGHDLPHPPGHPSHRPIYPGGRPDNSLPPWEAVGVWPPGPTDPAWGVDAPNPGGPSHPIYIPIGRPGHPDQGLPPVAGHPAPPIASVPPGTIWPPLPPGAPAGKTALIVWLVGVGWRYVVVDIPASPPTAGHLPGQTPQPK